MLRDSSHGHLLQLLLYTVFSGATGALTGSALGFLGSAIRDTWLWWPMSIAVGIAALGPALGELAVGRPVFLLQRSRETPVAWLNYGPFTWALKTGAVIGAGALTRLGFSTFYALVLAVLLMGDAFLGALVYGAYAFLRAAISLPVGAKIRKGADFRETGLAMLELRGRMSRVSGLITASFVFVCVVVIGLG